MQQLAMNFVGYGYAGEKRCKHIDTPGQHEVMQRPRIRDHSMHILHA